MNKEILQSKIKEEISKLEKEWGDVLYRDTETVVAKSLENCENMRSEWIKNSRSCPNKFTLELEEFNYINATNVTYHKALLSAIKRKDKLLNLSGMFNLVSGNSISIDEDVYRFLYNEFGCEKPVYKPFKETKIYELLSKQVQEREVPEYNPIPNPPPPPPPVSVGGTISDLVVSKQERQYLVWFLGTVIIALVLLLIYK